MAKALPDRISRFHVLLSENGREVSMEVMAFDDFSARHAAVHSLSLEGRKAVALFAVQE